MTTFLTRTCWLMFFAISNLLPAWAQVGQVENIALYEGADRQQRLVAEARKEGSLTLYTSMAAPNLEVLRVDFEKKYGVKLNVWRAGDVKVVQRILTEAKAGRAGFDLVHINSLEMEALHRENVLQQVKSPHLSKLVANALPSHKEYVATRLSPIVLAYNTDKIKKTELPKTYQDLLDPKWKGRLGIEANDQEWFYAVIKDMGTEKGLKYFRELVATNNPSVRIGHSLLNNMVVSGDVPLALTVYGHMPVLAKQKGAPIDWFALKPTAAVSFAAGLGRKAAHPSAAILFYDYMITDAQKLLAEMHYIPTHKETESSFKDMEYTLVDKAVFLDEFNKWDALWESIVLKTK
jgi:iron(III) transport system substrate-binding protein